MTQSCYINTSHKSTVQTSESSETPMSPVTHSRITTCSPNLQSRKREWISDGYREDAPRVALEKKPTHAIDKSTTTTRPMKGEQQS